MIRMSKIFNSLDSLFMSLKYLFYLLSIMGMIILIYYSKFTYDVFNRFVINLVIISIVSMLALLCGYTIFKLILEYSNSIKKAFDILIKLSSFPLLFTFIGICLFSYKVLFLYWNNSLFYEISIFLSLIISTLFSSLHLLLIIPKNKEQEYMILVDYLGGKVKDYFKIIAVSNLKTNLYIYILSFIKYILVNILPLYLIIQIGILYFDFKPVIISYYYPYYLIDQMIKQNYNIGADVFAYMVILFFVNYFINYYNRELQYEK